MLSTVDKKMTTTDSLFLSRENRHVNTLTVQLLSSERKGDNKILWEQRREIPYSARAGISTITGIIIPQVISDSFVTSSLSILGNSVGSECL